MPPDAAGQPRVLEIGAGLGTMVARLLEWQVITAGEYTLLDVDRRLLQDSRAWLCEWARARGLPTQPLPDGVRLGELRVRLVEAELGDYLEAGHGEPAELLIANAFLDLVDVPAVLPGLLRLLVPGGVYWFTINFDGESIFQPDHPHDDEVMGAYHRSMDDRVRYGRSAGESRTGRHLFGHLRAAGAPPLSAGSSDWVVLAGPDGTYPDDEAYFLETILQTVQDALDGPARRPALPTGSPSAAVSSPAVSWSTWPTSWTSPADRQPGEPPLGRPRDLDKRTTSFRRHLRATASPGGAAAIPAAGAS